jgi:polysaccharide export outer membrane protein
MHRSVIAVFVLTTLSLSCFGQSESLLIGPGDLIFVKVFDTPEMTQQIRVTDAGTAPLAFIGELKLVGQTPGEASKTIEAALVQKQLMRHPQVTLLIEDYATQNVSVLGQVRNPGVFPIATPQPILKVLSQAGGLTDMADRNVTIERHNDPSHKVHYYLANNSDKALSEGVTVYPGDTVMVPKAGIVYILGDVAHPGGYSITTNDSILTILRALALAGSANKTALESHARLIRKTQQGQQDLPIQLSAIEKGKQVDLILQPDDVLYVPFSWAKNMAVSASAIVSSTSGAAIYAAH